MRIPPGDGQKRGQAMKKTAMVRLQLLSAMSSLALAFGCGTQPTHSKVCGDDAGREIELEKCEEDARRYQNSRRTDGSHAYVLLYHWYYGPHGRRYLATGSTLQGFSRTMPTGKGVSISYPSAGSSRSKRLSTSSARRPISIGSR
jgi:hypothetical protein